MQQSVLHTDNGTDSDIQPHSHSVREVGLLLYHHNAFPAGCMGPATLSVRISVATAGAAGLPSGQKEDVIDPRVQVRMLRFCCYSRPLQLTLFLWNSFCGTVCCYFRFDIFLRSGVQRIGVDLVPSRHFR